LLAIALTKRDEGERRSVRQNDIERDHFRPSCGRPLLESPSITLDGDATS
jgi:hypothetical protein